MEQQVDGRKPVVGVPGERAPDVADSAYPSSFRSTHRNVDSDGGTSRPHRSLRASEF